MSKPRYVVAPTAAKDQSRALALQVQSMGFAEILTPESHHQRTADSTHAAREFPTTKVSQTVTYSGNKVKGSAQQVNGNIGGQSAKATSVQYNSNIAQDNGLQLNGNMNVEAFMAMIQPKGKE